MEDLIIAERSVDLMDKDYGSLDGLKITVLMENSSSIGSSAG